MEVDEGDLGRHIERFHLRYVDGHQTEIDRLPVWGTRPPVRLVVRSFDVCKVGGRYVRDCETVSVGLPPDPRFPLINVPVAVRVE